MRSTTDVIEGGCILVANWNAHLKFLATLRPMSGLSSGLECLGAGYNVNRTTHKEIACIVVVYDT
jgi:hypothetical protein